MLLKINIIVLLVIFLVMTMKKKEELLFKKYMNKMNIDEMIFTFIKHFNIKIKLLLLITVLSMLLFNIRFLVTLIFITFISYSVILYIYSLYTKVYKGVRSTKEFNTIYFNTLLKLYLLIFIRGKRFKSTILIIINLSIIWFYGFYADKAGYVDINGKFVINAKYDNAYSFIDDLALVNIDDKHGCFNTEGKTIIPIKYDNITSCFSYLDEAYAYTKENGKRGIIDKNGNKVIASINGSIWFDSKTGLIIVTEPQHKKGVIDMSGKVIVPIENERVTIFNNYILARENHNSYKIFDFNGNKIDYFNTRSDSRSYIVVSKDNKYGVIDRDYNIVIPYKYDYLQIEDDYFIIVRDNSKYGIINIDEDIVIPIKYTSSSYYSNEGMFKNIDLFDDKGNYNISFSHSAYLIIKDNLNDKEGIMDNNGIMITPIIYDSIEDYPKANVFIVQLNDKYRIIDKENIDLNSILYDSIKYIGIDMFTVSRNNKFSIVDKDNNIIIESEYEPIWVLGDNLIAKKDNMYGLISFKDEIILDFEYEEIALRGDKFAEATYGEKKVYINSEGLLFEYDNHSTSVNHDYLNVRVNDKEGLVDYNNNIIVPIEYSYVYGDIDPKKGFEYFIAVNEVDIGRNQVRRQRYLYNTNGIVIETDFNSIDYIGDGLFKVMKNNKYGVIDINGKIILPIKYVEIEKNYYSDLIKVKRSDYKFWKLSN